MKKKIKSFRDLETWQEAMTLVQMIYRVTEKLPSSEQFGLTNQIRRAAVSIPSNIAEGHGRLGTRELSHHLSITRGSLCEVQTQLILCVQLQFLSREESADVWHKSEEVARLLNGFIRSLNANPTQKKPNVRTPKRPTPKI